jgi:predicted dehydrogenase
MHRITMLGTGLIGMFYTRSLHAQRSRDQVQVVCSKTEAHARKFAEEHHIPRWTTSIEDAINDPETDIVVVGLPNNLHLEAVQLTKPL